MKQTIITTSALTATLLLFAGCGSSSSSATAPAPQPTTGTAFYLDSAVEGVTATCGSQVSQTDANGMFTYEDGKDCQFSIGDIVLRNESGLYQDKVIIEDNIRTAQYLQSMDSDGNPSNGIAIDPQTATVMRQNGITHTPATDEEIANSVVHMQNAGIGYQGQYVHESDAYEHVQGTKEQHPGAGQPGQPGTGTPGQPNSGDQDHQGTPGQPGTGTPGQPGTGTPGQPNNGDQDHQGTPGTGTPGQPS